MPMFSSTSYVTEISIPFSLSFVFIILFTIFSLSSISLLSSFSSSFIPKFFAFSKSSIFSSFISLFVTFTKEIGK